MHTCKFFILRFDKHSLEEPHFFTWCRKYGKGECGVAEKFTQQNVLLVVELICTSVIFSPKRKSEQISDSPMTFELLPVGFFQQINIL